MELNFSLSFFHKRAESNSLLVLLQGVSLLSVLLSRYISLAKEDKEVKKDKEKKSKKTKKKILLFVVMSLKRNISILL